MKNLKIEAVIVAVGIALLGLFTFLGLKSVAGRDRVVSVRGLAEREVKADHVIWPVVYKTTGNDLQALYREISDANTKIRAYLVRNGIADSCVATGAPQIIDLQADRYASNEAGRDRYNVTCVTTVSTADVDRVLTLQTRMGELLKEGIAISAGDYQSTPQFQFNGLNLIKPQMIEEATVNARKAAEKFAKDSDSSLGKIKNATQGLFSITDRDQYTPQIKQVRVVTSVNYYLES